MIREHEFNTRWWGARVGILSDPGFFDLSVETRLDMLAGFAWVEYYAALESCAAPGKISAADFYQVDTQIPFRIGLPRIAATPSVERLRVRTAEVNPFRLSADDLAPFKHERFRFLPGMTERKLNQRYAQWSNLLIEQQPSWCLEVLDGDTVEGWFLACMDERNRFELTLAMLRSGAGISGLLLYQRAMVEYARRGVRVGSAKFSVTNTPVVNIYSSLGARFLAPLGCWLWQGGVSESTDA